MSVNATQIDWHIRECCNFCITVHKTGNSISMRSRSVDDENCIVRCITLKIQLTAELTCQIHLKRYPTHREVKQAQHTRKIGKKSELKSEYDNLTRFCWAREKFYTIHYLRFRDYSSVPIKMCSYCLPCAVCVQTEREWNADVHLIYAVNSQAQAILAEWISWRATRVIFFPRFAFYKLSQIDWFANGEDFQ